MKTFVLKRGLEYTLTIEKLLKNGFDFGSKAKEKEAEKVASFSSEILRRIKQEDFREDGLWASCLNIWSLTKWVEDEKERVEAYCKKMGIETPKPLAWWLCDSKDTVAVTKATAVFTDELTDTARYEPVTFIGAPCYRDMLQETKKMFQGCYYIFDGIRLEGIRRVKETYYTYNGMIYKKEE